MCENHWPTAIYHRMKLRFAISEFLGAYTIYVRVYLPDLIAVAPTVSQLIEHPPFYHANHKRRDIPNHCELSQTKRRNCCWSFDSVEMKSLSIFVRKGVCSVWEGVLSTVKSCVSYTRS